MSERHPKPGELADREAAEISAEAAIAASAWWHRVPQLLRHPVPVFRALRETSDIEMDARSEPITAIMILAGMAGVVLTSAWGGLLDHSTVDGLVVAVLTFIGGVFYGGAGYFVLGAAVWLGARGAGVDTSYRLARQIVGLAALPVALSLFVTVPLILAWVGGDWFRSGGDDVGSPRWVISGIALAFAAWAVALVALGLRITLKLPWNGVAIALALAGVLVAGLVLVSAVA